MSVAEKKKERSNLLSGWMGVLVPVLVSATTPFSLCVSGWRAIKRCLCQTGGMDGTAAPRASSPTANRNWAMPAPSHIA